jgi:hypothetical protein
MIYAAGIAVWLFVMVCVLAIFSANGRDEDE